MENNGPDMQTVDISSMESKSSLDLFREKRAQEDNLRTQIEQKIAPLSVVVNCNKNEIVDADSNRQVEFRADDLISVKIQSGQKGEALWSIKNETLAQLPNKPKFEGHMIDATPEDVQQFIDQLDPTKIGIHKLKDIPDEMQRNPNKKSFILKDKGGHTVSLAYLSVDQGSHQAFIGALATNPEYFGKGSGSALLSEIKKQFGTLNLSAVPFDKNPEANDSYQKLYKFYKENGFVGAASWSKSTLSLDDLEIASQEQVLDEYKIYKIGNDNSSLSIDDFKRLIFNKIIQDPKIFNGFSKELQTQLIEWKNVNTQRKMYRDQIEKSSKE